MIAFQDLAQGFAMAIKAVLMYTDRHPRATAAIAQLHAQLEQWLTHRNPLQVAASAGKLFADGTPVEGTSVHVQALARQFSERQISGMTFQRGLTQDELARLIQVLILKPARIEEQGGIFSLFEKLALRHISLTQTQYKEVKDGEELVSSSKAEQEHTRDQEGEGFGGGEGHAEIVLAPTRSMSDITRALDAWKEAMKALWSAGQQPPTGWTPPFPGALPPADLGGLGPIAQQLGWGSLSPSSAQLEPLRQAIAGLSPERQMALVEGIPSLPAHPLGLSLGLKGLAPELLATASGAILAQGRNWGEVRDALYDALRRTPGAQANLGTLAHKLMGMGVDLEHVEGLLRQLDWDGQPLDVQIRRAIDQHEFWQLTHDQRLLFLHRLLEEERTEPFHHLIEEAIARLADEDPRIREAAATTLADAARWIDDPGLPPEIEGRITEGLQAHFGWEPMAQILRYSREGLHAVLVALLKREELREAQSLIEGLDGLCAMSSGTQPWRMDALIQLKTSLVEPDLFTHALGALYDASPDMLREEMVPFFEFLGKEGMDGLMEHLGTEQDRRRRGRLLETIRFVGSEALPAIQANLASPTWYVVRNALNLIAELGHAGQLKEVTPHLRHKDPRVRQAAVRATARLGGPAAESPLIEVLAHTDPDTQLEVLFALAGIRSQRAVQAVLPLAVQATTPEAVRLKAIETLGLCGHPSTLGPLLELVRRKGRIFTSAEPMPIRTAALRALRALGTSEALSAAREAVNGESRSDDRKALQEALEGP